RRSGRVSNRKKRTQEDDEYEVIDLTTKEWDRAGDDEVESLGLIIC
nr:hypothetical protein [Tanacetum cinerariifolium]